MKASASALFFQDEARIGQKGRVCHVWWKRGERPPGLCDRRFTFAYIFAAVEPGTDNAFALIMPDANTERCRSFSIASPRRSPTTSTSPCSPIKPDGTSPTTCGARQHHAGAAAGLLAELNPVERLWLYLKERFLSHRLLDDYDAIVDAACSAWNRLVGEVGRIKSLCSYPWIEAVTS